MSLPLPPPTSAANTFVDMMDKINALSNNKQIGRYNKVKADWANTTIPAEAYSKLAYANAVSPQLLAKFLRTPGVIANIGDPAARAAAQTILKSGMRTPPGPNAFNNMPTQYSGISSQPKTNSFSGQMTDALKSVLSLFGQGNKQNTNPDPFAQMGGQQPMQQQPAMQQSSPMQAPQQNAPQSSQSDDGIDHALDEAYMDWMNSPEGDAEIQKGQDAKVPSPEQLIARMNAKKGLPTMQMELTGGQRPDIHQDTWEEKQGKFEGTLAELKALGKHRGDVINDIGEQQMQLSNTGANLDRLVSDINDPKFMALRKDFPFYQNMQLTALSKVGSPEQQEMIGNFIADLKSFAGATVNSFKGQTMKREFDYADQLKPNENDTVSTSRGKLTALKSLKEIAEHKNEIISDLMQKKHMNLVDAVKQANKMVDVRAISDQVKKLTAPMIKLRNPKQPNMFITLPLWEARQRGVKNV